MWLEDEATGDCFNFAEFSFTRQSGGKAASMVEFVKLTNEESRLVFKLKPFELKIMFVGIEQYERGSAYRGKIEE